MIFWHNSMIAWAKYLLDILLPPRCKLCGKIVSDDDSLCPECFNKINFVTRPYCAHCGQPLESVSKASKHFLCPNCAQNKLPWFRLARSAFRYEEDSKNLILSFKFYDRTDNAKILAKFMKNAAQDIFDKGVDLIVPVPLHYTRLFKRKYNQSALLACELSKMTGVPVDFDGLVRHRKTRPQVEFSGKVRQLNVRNAFSVKRPDDFKGKHILLIDDVLTTGSTLKECAKALKKAHPSSIDLLTAARVCD